MGSKRISAGRLASLLSEAVPPTNNTYNLGVSSDRAFANIFCNDLHLKNERGDYTIVEEEEYLSLRNNKTGKLYKFVLEEVEEGGDE